MAKQLACLWCLAIMLVCLRETAAFEVKDGQAGTRHRALRVLRYRVKRDNSEAATSSLKKKRPEELGASRYDCVFVNEIIRHGATAILEDNPCWRSLCWYGRLYQRGDGCYVRGNCFAVDEIFEQECTTMKCTKTQWTASATFSYNLQILSSRCRDNEGRCRNIGDRYSDTINGEYHEDCWCQRTWPSLTSGTVCANIARET